MIVALLGTAAITGLVVNASNSGLGKHQWNLTIGQFQFLVKVRSLPPHSSTGHTNLIAVLQLGANRLPHPHLRRETRTPHANPTLLRAQQRRQNLLGQPGTHRRQRNHIHCDLLPFHLLLRAAGKDLELRDRGSVYRGWRRAHRDVFHQSGLGYCYPDPALHGHFPPSAPAGKEVWGGSHLRVWTAGYYGMYSPAGVYCAFQDRDG